ncbi:MAG TPA: HepT-like ribonuclease domain-containing protein [Tepidisphaeraceae bacterium]|nr:HepT-like ribonuclease domain-containing protein [Tepidisphaeraceae bacterium]
MSRHEPQVSLRHMLDHADECVRMMEDVRREDLLQDRKLFLAVVRLLEIVGEAANRIPRDHRDRIADIPWQQIIRMRNHLSHAYENINFHIVWDTVHDDLPPLIRTLRALLGEGQEP